MLPSPAASDACGLCNPSIWYTGINCRGQEGREPALHTERAAMQHDNGLHKKAARSGSRGRGGVPSAVMGWHMGGDEG